MLKARQCSQCKLAILYMLQIPLDQESFLLTPSFSFKFSCYQPIVSLLLFHSTPFPYCLFYCSRSTFTKQARCTCWTDTNILLLSPTSTKFHGASCMEQEDKKKKKKDYSEQCTSCLYVICPKLRQQSFLRQQILS